MIQTGKNILISANASNYDIRGVLEDPRWLKEARNQISGKTDVFLGRTEEDTCKNLWRYLKHNIHYKEDGIAQQVKLPGRLKKDGQGDCKSYALFIISHLKEYGIPARLKYASYNGGRLPRHVYVQTDSGIIIDPVWHSFNQEKPYTYAYFKRI